MENIDINDSLMETGNSNIIYYIYKDIYYIYKDEDNSPKIINDKNHRAFVTEI